MLFCPSAIQLSLCLQPKSVLHDRKRFFLVGLLITGQDLLFGFTGLIQSALGNADYIWVIGIEVFIGIMVAFFQKSGAIEAVANKLNEKLHITPRIAQPPAALLPPGRGAGTAVPEAAVGRRAHRIGLKKQNKKWEEEKD